MENHQGTEIGTQIGFVKPKPPLGSSSPRPGSHSHPGSHVPRDWPLWGNQHFHRDHLPAVSRVPCWEGHAGCLDDWEFDPSTKCDHSWSPTHFLHTFGQGGVRHCLGGPRATLRPTCQITAQPSNWFYLQKSVVHKLKIDEEFQSHSSTKEQRPHTLVFVRFKQMGNPAYRSAPHSTETKEGKKRPGMYCVLFQS